MELKRKCQKCKSQNLTYSEEWDIRHWKWWQWVIGWGAAVALIPLGLGIIDIALVPYLIYCMVVRKRKYYLYTCQECGFSHKV